MRFLRPAYLHYTKPGPIIDAKQFLRLLVKVKLRDDDFNVENFQPGTSGETKLLRELIEQSGVGNDMVDKT